MKIANSGGFLLALHEQNLINDFNTVVGDSAGAILAAYGLSGQTDIVQKLFFENANKFIKWSKGKPSIDVDLIANLLKEGEFILNVEAVLNSKPDFFIAVAGESGSCEFINAKDSKINLIDLLKASMASPFFYGKKVEINGQSLADPLMDQLPLLQATRNFSPTDVLVLENSSVNLRAKPYSKFLNTILSIGEVGVINATNDFLDRPSYEKDFKTVDHDLHVNLGVLFPPKDSEGLSALETRADVLRKSADVSKQKALKILGIT